MAALGPVVIPQVIGHGRQSVTPAWVSTRTGGAALALGELRQQELIRTQKEGGRAAVTVTHAPIDGSTTGATRATDEYPVMDEY